MKLRRPPITPGKWVYQGSDLYIGEVPRVYRYMMLPYGSRESIADAKAAAQLPEVMDFLERMAAWAQYMGGWEWEDDLKKLMLSMGYTEEPEGGEGV